MPPRWLDNLGMMGGQVVRHCGSIGAAMASVQGCLRTAGQRCADGVHPIIFGARPNLHAGWAGIIVPIDGSAATTVAATAVDGHVVPHTTLASISSVPVSRVVR